MWLRSDKRELRNRNQPKEEFKNRRKKRKRSKNQYCKTIKLMKKEKNASILKVKQQYSTGELTLYTDKNTLKTKKHLKVVNRSSNKKIFATNNNNNNKTLSYAPDSTVNQYHHSFDLNNLNIDLSNLRNNSVDDVSDENKTLDDYRGGVAEQYDVGFTVPDECNSSTIHTVSDMPFSK